MKPTSGRNKHGVVSPSDVVRRYASEATIHGVRYLASTSVTPLGKLCWFVALITCATFAGVFMHTAWLAYCDSPTRTSVESTHYPLHRVPFPAVTICPATNIRLTVGMKLLTRLCWFVALITCATFAGVFMHTAWLAYCDSPTRTSVESTHYPLHRVPFPAVTICPATNIRLTVGMKLLTRYLNVTTVDEGMRQQLWNVLSALSLHQFPFHFRVWPHIDSAKQVVPLLGDLNITEFMLTVLPPCDELFKQCFWQGRLVDCCEVFHLQRYEAGFCYSFNSMTLDSNLKCPPLTGVELGERAAPNPQNQACSLLRNGVSGTTTGLEVFLEPSKEEDRLGAGQRDADGARVFVHHPLQFPEAGKGLLMMEQNDTVLTVQVSAAVTESSLSLRTLSYRERQCYFPDEWQLEVSRTYSQKNCLLECRLHHFIDKCQCVPYFFNRVLDQPVCNLSRLICVAQIDRDLRFLRLQATQAPDEESFLNCSHCLPTCHDVTYRLDASISKDSNPILRGAYLDVYYADLSAFKYRRELAFDNMQLIVSFGGIAGLFLGVSLLSCVELLYYAAVLLQAVVARQRSRNKRNKVWHVAPCIQQT